MKRNRQPRNITQVEEHLLQSLLATAAASNTKDTLKVILGGPEF